MTPDFFARITRWHPPADLSLSFHIERDSRTPTPSPQGGGEFTAFGVSSRLQLANRKRGGGFVDMSRRSA